MMAAKMTDPAHLKLLVSVAVERDLFYMKYRMQCDVDTKRLETELAAANARIAELEHQNAVLRDAHQRANAESLRLAELLNKAAPDWGSPMRLT